MHCAASLLNLNAVWIGPGYTFHHPVCITRIIQSLKSFRMQSLAVKLEDPSDSKDVAGHSCTGLRSAYRNSSSHSDQNLLCGLHGAH